MQVNSPRQEMLNQVRSAMSDRRVTPQEMQSLQNGLANSNLNTQDKEAVAQILNKLGEFTQVDQYLTEPEFLAIEALAARLGSPAATRFSEELRIQNQAAQAADSGNASGRGSPLRSSPTADCGEGEKTSDCKKSRNIFQIIWEALKSLFKWIASLFGGGDKSDIKGPGRAGSAASTISFDQFQAPAAPPNLPPLENLQDYSQTEFAQGEYLNDYARPEVPTDANAFNQYLAVPSSLRPSGGTKPASGEPAANTAAPTPEGEGLAAPTQPAAITTQGRPRYQPSPWHDDSKFVPRFPMAAFHESGVYRKDWDPYAVGAISRPRKSDDLGGKTYGTYQFESSIYTDGTSRGNRGGVGSTLHRFINDPANPFGPHLKAAAEKYGLASRAFDALWTKFAREHNQAFGQAQEAFVLKDKGDNVQRFMELARLSPEVRQDPRIIDLIMGTTNHVGELADSAARHLADLQQRTGRPLTANEVGRALAEYKETRISSWFRSSPGAHQGLENRFNAERRSFA